MASDKTKNSLILEINDWLEDIIEFLIPVRSLLVSLSNVFTVILSIVLAFYFRHDFSFHTPEVNYLPKVILLAVLVKFIIFLVFRLYEGMWRYVSITDLLKIFFANLIASIILLGIVSFYRSSYFPGFSLNVLLIDFLICFLTMSGKRVVMRIIREYAAKATGVQNLRTLIVGNMENVNSLIYAFSSMSSRRKIIGALCEDVKIGHTIRGVPVLGEPPSAAKCAKKHRASEILLLPPYSTPASIREIMDDLELRETKCALRMVPAYSDIADGHISVSHIKEVEIEDLLGRKPVKLDRTEVNLFVKDKNIMVTGAGGSIGSELCHQIAAYKPAKLVLFEFSEFNLYEINRKLSSEYPQLQLVNFIGDIRSEENISRALSEHRIDIVYHSAAFKHVPLMEENPLMAFGTNVIGTATLADCCEKSGVKRVLLISTDKAVRPTSIMGATKRLAEKVILKRPQSSTEFVVVRFGNVLGSSGSVIPLFKQQIRDGGPVTVTTGTVTRYFMSIPEAVDLVLQAGAIGGNREIMVLEMGEQMKIYDMAKRLIELSGLIPGKDIEIKIVGMRPGEKEYEELFSADEKAEKTSSERIYVVKKNGASSLAVDVEKVRILILKNDVEAVKKLVCGYIPDHKLS